MCFLQWGSFEGKDYHRGRVLLRVTNKILYYRMKLYLYSLNTFSVALYQTLFPGHGYSDAAFQHWQYYRS